MIMVFLLSENLTVSLPDSENMPFVQADDIACTWSGGEIARMEWLFIDENTIIPMQYTNMSWNNEVFACMKMPNPQPELMNLTVKGKKNYALVYICV